MISVASSGSGINANDEEYALSFINGSGNMTHYMSDGYAIGIFASNSQDTKMVLTKKGQNEGIEYTLVSSYTKNGKTVYYTLTSGQVKSVTPMSDKESIDVYPTIQEFIWEMVYGNVGVKTVSIPVQWRSRYENKTYEASFDIEVRM